MNVLAPCPGCSRHVSAAEPRCPFCGAPPPLAPRPRLPTGRLGRAATFAFGAALAASACSETTGGDAGVDAGAIAGDAGADAGDAPEDAGSDAGTDAGAGDDAGTDAAIPDDAGTDSGGIFPPYGAPPRD